ncbi:hypothetical protein M2169_005782 [Streptomyces sp. MJP52]|nr:hypothetical protein [Streptomyces sp. MJP52]
MWPRWVPGLRGRGVPVLAVTVTGALGALACTVHGVAFVWTTLRADMAITLWGEWVMTVCYLPVVAWGPLLAAVTVHHHRRRTRG